MVARTPRRMNNEKDFLNPELAVTNENTIRPASPLYRDGDFSELVELRNMHKGVLAMIEQLQKPDLYETANTKEKKRVTDLYRTNIKFLSTNWMVR